PLHRPVRPRLPIPAHRRRARGARVRLARHGPVVGRGDLSARLPSRHRDGTRGERGRGPGQPRGGRAVRRRGSPYPRARRGAVTVWTWLAFAAAVAVALLAAAEVRRHAVTQAAGRRFLRHPTATAGVFILAFFVT